MQIQRNSLRPRRWIAFLIAGTAVLLLPLYISAQGWMIVLVGIGLFLGITDYGRQCPLYLILHQYLVHKRKKG
jgi:hypothetical protein